jgi:hypothetical protein
MHLQNVISKKRWKTFFFVSCSLLKQGQDPDGDPYPDLKVSGPDPRIRIRTKIIGTDPQHCIPEMTPVSLAEMTYDKIFEYYSFIRLKKFPSLN